MRALIPSIAVRAPIAAWIVPLGALLAGGCSAEESPSPVPVALPAADGGADAGAPRIPPLAPPSEPELLAVPSWMRTIAKSPATADPVRDELEQGSFTVPAQEGKRDDGTWKLVASKDDGGLGAATSGSVLYAAANVVAPPGSFLFARPDRVLSVWTDSAAVHPGDLYGSGRIRVPLAVSDQEQHSILVRALGGSGEPQIQIFSTRDELVLDLADVTAPDPVEGDTSTQYLGVPVLDVAGVAADDLAARVEESPYFQATAIHYPSLPAGAVTQLAFQLVPLGPLPAAGTRITVGLRLESPSLQASYRRELTLVTAPPGKTYRRSFRSALDGSAQYYGVVPPSGFDPKKSYALVLTLHGAAVEAIGQAQAYSPKDWAYVVAPTNRRPYGFDWESFGRLDAIEVLDQAAATFATASDRVYLTGHSMGGHGTWSFGALFPGRFATIGPSAGWGSYYTYAGLAKPTGAFARSQAASDTLVYLENLARRGAYVIHGSADDNVPVSEAQAMVAAVSKVTSDVVYWEQPGAGHWWDGSASPGADCVDWPPLFDFMKARSLAPFELDFTFKTPSPWVSPRHSFVTVRSQESAYGDSSVTSARAGDTVTLTTLNVRSLEIAGGPLRAAGVTKLAVDGAVLDVPDGPLAVGPEDGKRPGAGGPFDEVLARPFCFVWADDGPATYARYAAYLLSAWQVMGNGQGCGVPLSRVTDELRARYGLIYLGVPSASIPALAGLPVAWGDAITVGGKSWDEAGLAVVFPENGRLAGAIAAPKGREPVVFRFQPFRSVFAAPDYVVFSRKGTEDAGFFTPDWKSIEPPVP